MRQRGSTLLEVLIAIFVFAIIMVIATSVFVYSLNLQRRAFNLQKVQENVNYALDLMAKEIRVSTISAGSDNVNCSTSSPLTITHPDFGSIQYYLSGANLMRVGSTSAQINSTAVEFISFSCSVKGTATADGLQPRVTIKAKAQSVVSNQQVSMEVQTTITPRVLSD